ncbi:glutaredoxin family protein [Lapillicoccus jejuensis]|uniref:Glutaredoxin n=1 Tax=Lapillicoccus jejuensis TaxID=402171 RepID=A0A542DXN9_9MICO|nr:glutaredoxin family protein [Lapillicoccus jejuensis]TQJ07694.1 glutaredoxin [Lapillicoccus jejuensis]
MDEQREGRDDDLLPGAGADRARVTLLGRAGCHLCDEARTVVAAVADDLGVGWREVDVDADPRLRERYSEQVPVTFVDGVQHDFWRVSESRLRAALARPARGGSRGGQEHV